MDKMKRWLKYLTKRTQPIEWVTLINPTDKVIPFYEMGEWFELLPNDAIYVHKSRVQEMIEDYGMEPVDMDTTFYSSPEEALEGKNNSKTIITE